MRAVVLLIVLFLSIAAGQRVIRVYYDFDEFKPAELRFDGSRIGGEKLACGALFDPAPGSADPPLAEVRYPRGPGALLPCANPDPYPNPERFRDPVVVLGYDADTEETAPAFRIRIVFLSHEDVPFEYIQRALEARYRLVLNVEGNWQRADLRVADGLGHPRDPYRAPPERIRWLRLQPEVKVRFSRKPELKRCFSFFYRSCYLATWALPVHLRVHGNETSGFELRVRPETIEETARGLSVQGGRLLRIEIRPSP